MFSYQTIRPYHPENLKHQPFPHWKIICLAWIGNLIGVQFKVNAIPFGAEYDAKLWNSFTEPRIDYGVAGRQKPTP